MSQSDEPSEDIGERLTRVEQQLSQALEGAPARPRRNWDAYAAVIASFIGLLALAVSAYTARVQRQQLRAQVWPHVQLETSSVDSRIFMDNQGTGPARITAMSVKMHGALMRNWSAVQKAVGYKGEIGLIWSDVGEAVLSSGKELRLVAPADEQSIPTFKELLPGGSHELSITLCYCSVLDDCWITSLDEHALAIDTCSIPVAERFLR